MSKFDDAKKIAEVVSKIISCVDPSIFDAYLPDSETHQEFKDMCRISNLIKAFEAQQRVIPQVPDSKFGDISDVEPGDQASAMEFVRNIQEGVAEMPQEVVNKTTNETTKQETNELNEKEKKE